MSVPEIAQEIVVGPTLAETSWDDRFARVVEAHSRYLFRVAYAVLRNAHDAEDAVQETFLKVYRARRWDHVENERAFLARAVWRAAVDRAPNRPSEQPDVEMASTRQTPEEAAIVADRSALVTRLIDALPDELRRPLALSAIEEMTSGQIAALLEIPEATVRGRVMRARQILKDKLAAYAR